MTKYVVLNKTTARKRGGSVVRVAVTVGMITLATVGGIRGYNSITTHRSAGAVESAIEQRNYAQAAQLLESYSADGKISKSAAAQLRSSLDSEVQRQPYLQKFDAALKTFALDDARRIIGEMESNGLADKKLATSLEARVQDLTPETLYAHILAAKPDQREPLLREYITAYPTGEYAPEVRNKASEIMVTKLIDLGQSVKAGRAFDETYTKLVSINQALSAYAGKGLALSAVPTSDLLKEVTDYLQLPYYPAPKGTNASVGSNVKTHAVSIADSNQDKKYVEERTANFPDGSVGEIIYLYSYNGHSTYYVRFAPGQYTWSGNWNLQDYWLSGNKNVASYVGSEIQIVMPVTAIQTAQFDQQAKTLVGLIGASGSPAATVSGPQK